MATTGFPLHKANDDRVPTGIEGFDTQIEGGFPRGDLILLVGHPGSGKTILSAQFLHTGGSKYAEPGIYASFAENREAFLRNMRRFGLEFAQLEQQGLFKFMDFLTVKERGIEDTLSAILDEIGRMKAKRLVIDSFSALAQAFYEKIEARIVLHTVLGKMTRISGVTTLLIAEKALGSEALGAGMEEFVSDAVVILTHAMQKGRMTRNLDIVKMRGTKTARSRLKYDIAETGMMVYPPLTAYLPSRVYSERLSTGVEGLDKMLGGGLYKGSTMLVMGESGTGKTTSALQFLYRGAINNERTLFVSYEESPEELTRHALGFGWKLNEYAQNGLVRVSSHDPEPGNMDKIFTEVRKAIAEHKPSRLIVDGLTNIERTMEEDDFFQSTKRLVTRCKAEGMTCLTTARTNEGALPSDVSVSSMTDVILSLRQVESQSALRRALVIFKARGLAHDSSIREFEITPRGIVVEEKFADLEQILSGSARRPVRAEAWSDAFGGLPRTKAGSN